MLVRVKIIGSQLISGEGDDAKYTLLVQEKAKVTVRVEGKEGEDATYEEVIGENGKPITETRVTKLKSLVNVPSGTVWLEIESGSFSDKKGKNINWRRATRVLAEKDLSTYMSSLV